MAKKHTAVATVKKPLSRMPHPCIVVRREWPHFNGATGPESIRSEIIVTWDRWQDVSLPLSRHSFFGPTAEYHPSVEEDDPIIAAANWHHLRTSMVALFRHECWNGITSNPSAETMARLIGEASNEPIFPAQHTAKQLEAARKAAVSQIQTPMMIFLSSLPHMLEVEIKGKSAPAVKVSTVTRNGSADTSKNIEIVPTSRAALAQDLLTYQFNERASGKSVEVINREFFNKNKRRLGKRDVEREKAFATVKRTARRCKQRA